jgi:uncharacterized protein (DUF433 family)
VTASRVTLASLVAAFETGASAEEISQQYPSLALADIYSVIAFYLRHQSEVKAYLAQLEIEASEILEKIETRSNQAEFRDKLMARWNTIASSNKARS